MNILNKQMGGEARQAERESVLVRYLDLLVGRIESLGVTKPKAKNHHKSGDMFHMPLTSTCIKESSPSLGPS